MPSFVCFPFPCSLLSIDFLFDQSCSLYCDTRPMLVFNYGFFQLNYDFLLIMFCSNCWSVHYYSHVSCPYWKREDTPLYKLDDWLLSLPVGCSSEPPLGLLVVYLFSPYDICQTSVQSSDEFFSYSFTTKCMWSIYLSFLCFKSLILHWCCDPVLFVVIN